MSREFKFALYALKKNIQSNAEMRVSFLLSIVGMFINNLSFVIIWTSLVKSIGVMNGWTEWHIIGALGFASMPFGFVFAFCGGLPNMGKMIDSGQMDQYLLSPKNILLRIATATFTPSAIGDIIFGAICIILFLIGIDANLLQCLVAILASFLSVLLFLSLTITIHSISFYFSDADLFVRGVFELFLTPALFHGGAFQGIMRFMFVFIIPSLLINSIPIESIAFLSIKSIIIMSILPILWFCFSLYFFKVSVKRYTSSNFMTFGSV